MRGRVSDTARVRRFRRTDSSLCLFVLLSLLFVFFRFFFFDFTTATPVGVSRPDCNIRFSTALNIVHSRPRRPCRVIIARSDHWPASGGVNLNSNFRAVINARRRRTRSQACSTACTAWSCRSYTPGVYKVGETCGFREIILDGVFKKDYRKIGEKNKIR